MNERVYLACDVSNVWKACRTLHGKEARVNFEVLKDVVPSLMADVEQRLVAYTVEHPRAVHKNFEEVLTSLGYEIKSRKLVYVDELRYPLNINWTTGITLDLLDVHDTYDTAVIVTGDGSYEDIIVRLKETGKKVIVIAFDTPASKVLYREASELWALSGDIVYNQDD